jgi:hypothetical protein
MAPKIEKKVVTIFDKGTIALFPRLQRLHLALFPNEEAPRPAAMIQAGLEKLEDIWTRALERRNQAQQPTN